MFALERRERIYDHIVNTGKATVIELSEDMNVSQVTIRKDLRFLEEQGLIDRTFGGAVIKKHVIEEQSYSEKEEFMAEEKVLIGQKAAEFVKANSTIILDAGTSVTEMAKHLSNIEGLKVITSNIKAALYLSDFSNIEVTLIGGRVSSKFSECLGVEACENVKKYNADACFLGCDAFDLKNGFMTTNVEKMYLKRHFMAISNRCFLLVTSDKYNKKSMVNVESLDRLKGIIVDRNSKELMKDFEQVETDNYIFV